MNLFYIKLENNSHFHFNYAVKFLAFNNFKIVHRFKKVFLKLEIGWIGD